MSKTAANVIIKSSKTIPMKFNSIFNSTIIIIMKIRPYKIVPKPFKLDSFYSKFSFESQNLSDSQEKEFQH